jgi:ribosomal-protein-alanine N-acetyltransferase
MAGRIVREEPAVTHDVPRFRTSSLLLRAWTDADRTPFAALNAEPGVVAWRSCPLDRLASDGFIDRRLGAGRSTGSASGRWSASPTGR